MNSFSQLEHGLDGAVIFIRCGDALKRVRDHVAAVQTGLGNLLLRGDKIDRAEAIGCQHLLHGFAWCATYFYGLRELLGWAKRAEVRQPGGSHLVLLLLVFQEYLAQLAGGIPMSQSEMARPGDYDADPSVTRSLLDAAAALEKFGRPATLRKAMAAELLIGGTAIGEEDSEELGIIRKQFAKYAAARIAPETRRWHAKNALIPADLIEELAELGAFGLTVPIDYEGLSLGKLPMCVVTEELARASLAAASLGTRSEIAAELIGLHGTEAQKRQWLPGIASAKVLPAAVFTEPDTGSDLAHVRTRAEPSGGGYRIHGSKTWSTHASRANLLIILARLDQTAAGSEGLSIFLAGKPAGAEQDLFPIAGLAGSEIPVIGYRGMREYELAFDGFVVPGEALLGMKPGLGFRQLMSTFESARIQTAARAVGVARGALDAACAYAVQRKQFGRPISDFPRIYDKLAWMAAEAVTARELTYYAARRKDAAQRCDVEAGMAKLLAARVAWANADSAVQVHGGNGYAEEYPVSRMLCDARVLSIFEGASEIQADVIGRGLLTGRTRFTLDDYFEERV